MLQELFDQPSACRKEEPIKTSPVSLSWNENLHTLSHDGTWLREALDSILRSARIDTSILYSIMLEEMLVCSLSFTKGTSKPSCMSLFCFCLLISLLFLSIYFTNSGRHIVLIKYTLYKIYILKVFLNCFLLSSLFQGDSIRGLLI